MGQLFCFLNQASSAQVCSQHNAPHHLPNQPEKTFTVFCFCAPCVPRRRRKRGDTCAIPLQATFLLFCLSLSDFVQKMAFPMHLDKLYISFEGKVIAVLIIYSPLLREASMVGSCATCLEVDILLHPNRYNMNPRFSFDVMNRAMRERH